MRVGCFLWRKPLCSFCLRFTQQKPELMKKGLVNHLWCWLKLQAEVLTDSLLGCCVVPKQYFYHQLIFFLFFFCKKKKIKCIHATPKLTLLRTKSETVSSSSSGLLLSEYTLPPQDGASSGSGTPSLSLFLGLEVLLHAPRL